MTLRNMSFSESGAAFLSFDGDVLLDRQLRFLSRSISTLGRSRPAPEARRY